jgi:branched-subunit amino acid transport protein
MSGPWSVALVVALIAFSLRAVGPVLLGGKQLPAALSGLIELLPSALLAAFVVTQVFVSGSAFAIDARAVGVAAAAVAIYARLPLPVTLLLAASATALVRFI